VIPPEPVPQATPVEVRMPDAIVAQPSASAGVYMVLDIESCVVDALPVTTNVDPSKVRFASSLSAEVPLPVSIRLFVKLAAPVPPPATVRVPDCDGVNVSVSPEPTTVSADVMPFVADVDEAIVIVEPVCPWPVGPMVVMPPPAAASVVPS